MKRWDETTHPRMSEEKEGTEGKYEKEEEERRERREEKIDQYLFDSEKDLWSMSANSCFAAFYFLAFCESTYA